MTPGTADAEGRPWVSPVWFARSRYSELFWVSAPGARHSRNIAVRPDVAIVVFDSTVPIGSGRAVYMSALAERLTDEREIERGMAVFSSARSPREVPPGLPSTSPPTRASVSTARPWPSTSS